MDEGDRKGWVYLVEDPVHEAIKIGWAKDPAVRLKALQRRLCILQTHGKKLRELKCLARV